MFFDANDGYERRCGNLINRTSNPRASSWILFIGFMNTLNEFDSVDGVSATPQTSTERIISFLRFNFRLFETFHCIRNLLVLWRETFIMCDCKKLIGFIFDCEKNRFELRRIKINSCDILNKSLFAWLKKLFQLEKKKKIAEHGFDPWTSEFGRPSTLPLRHSAYGVERIFCLLREQT